MAGLRCWEALLLYSDDRWICDAVCNAVLRMCAGSATNIQTVIDAQLMSLVHEGWRYSGSSPALETLCTVCCDGTPDHMAYLISIGGITAFMEGLRPWNGCVAPRLLEACAVLLAHHDGVPEAMRAANVAARLRALPDDPRDALTTMHALLDEKFRREVEAARLGVRVVRRLRSERQSRPAEFVEPPF